MGARSTARLKMREVDFPQPLRLITPGFIFSIERQPRNIRSLMIQFFDTIRQIKDSDSVGVLPGIFRHLQWQVRKLFNGFPCELSLAGSKLHVEGPLSVAALVNSMGEYDYNNMGLLKLVLSDRKVHLSTLARISDRTRWSPPKSHPLRL